MKHALAIIILFFFVISSTYAKPKRYLGIMIVKCGQAVALVGILKVKTVRNGKVVIIRKLSIRTVPYSADQDRIAAIMMRRDIGKHIIPCKPIVGI
jgi:hypothetical protein